jgi:hypothetical protein
MLFAVLTVDAPQWVGSAGFCPLPSGSKGVYCIREIG